jgi:hypothetical protein
MSCERYASAIVDHACGAEIDADAGTHLAGCASCRELFDEQRRLLQQIDEDLQLALAIEPLPRFVPEVLARVERSAPAWPRLVWWAIPVAAAAVVMLVALGVLRSNREQIGSGKPTPPPSVMTTPPVAPAPSKSLPTQAPVAPPKLLAGSHRSTGPRAVVSPAIEREPRPAEVQLAVLTPPRQSQAIARYLSLVRRGALDTSALISDKDAGAAEPAELVIAPLLVDELQMTDVETRTGAAVDRRGPESR